MARRTSGWKRANEGHQRPSLLLGTVLLHVVPAITEAHHRRRGEPLREAFHVVAAQGVGRAVDDRHGHPQPSGLPL